MAASIYDVAAEAGVSIATVSRILNNSGTVSQKKTQAVYQAMEKLRYEPNQFARGLVKQRSDMIGVYLLGGTSVFDSSYYVGLLKGIQNVLMYRNKCMALIVDPPDCRKRLKDTPYFMEMVRQRRIDGLILSAPMQELIPEQVISELAQMKFPVTYIGQRDDERFCSVYAQFIEYHLDMIRQLRGRGHRKILMYLGEFHRRYFLQIQARCREQWPDVELCTVFIGGAVRTVQQYRADIQHYVLKNGCTAVCISDAENGGTAILGAAAQLGIQVPRQLSIVAVTWRYEEGERVYPRLSAYLVPAEDMGAGAANLLLQQLDGGEIEKSCLEYKTVFIERDSICEIE